jgi:hypothetical protein
MQDLREQNTLKQHVCALLEKGRFPGYTGPENVEILKLTALRSVKHGTVGEADKLRQRAHCDIDPSVFSEVGYCHSLMILQHQSRVLRGMNCDKRVFELLRLDPMTINMLNGVWTHGGWYVPASDPVKFHDVLFAHVLMKKKPAPST